jgi:hypothetical protein
VEIEEKYGKKKLVMTILNKSFYQVDKSSTTDIWLTPPSLIDSLGVFDLDPCCPNNLPWKTADKFLSLENGEDGLKIPWNGRVWCNPPYSNWASFLEKLKIHNNGIALIFARTETKGFFDHVWDSADSILFLKRRVKFIKSDFTGSGSTTAPSVLIAYGRSNTVALENCGLEGKLIKLKND